MRREVYFPNIKCLKHESMYYWEHHYKDLTHIYKTFLNDLYR
jgi:hypothetical protein